ncbi:MAG TPA: aldo/keto reductase [Alphaproteobacteria bacterium]|nr:aldo/keto reductase [Alphaproteobacteria bacterium]
MTVERLRLHAQGPELSRLVWGAWRSLASPETDTPAKQARLIEACLELGITSFDHADIYGGYAVEAAFGAALKEWRGDRGRIELVTKCGIALVDPARPAHRVKHYDTSAAHIRASVDASLRNLGTDYIDLLLIHRPDPLMDADEAAGALEALVKAGKVRHVGVSNHSPAQVDLLQSRLGLPLVTNQVELSVVATDPLFDGTLDQAQRLGAAPMAWSPLGGGGLFAANPDGQAARVAAALRAVGTALGEDDLGTLALAWLLRHPSRPVPVLGTSRIDRIRRYAAAGRLAFDRQQWFSVLEASLGRPVP